VLVRCRINRLSHLDRITGEPLRRYEHPHPGSLIHVDVTKFGNIPLGGGWRYVGRQQGDSNRAATDTVRRKGRVRGPVLGIAYVHTVIDDHSRYAYAEICTDEKAATAIGVLQRAVGWFTDHGVTVERVLSDNGSAYISRLCHRPASTWASSTCAPGPTGPRPTARSVKTYLAAALGRSDPGQGVTTVSCVRFVGRLWCSAVVRTGQVELT